MATTSPSQLTSEKYPSGKIVTMGYDAKGRLASIADQSRTYLNGLQFQGKGGSVSSMNFGNGKTEAFTLNNRMQMTNQTLTKASDVIQQYDYTFGELDSQSAFKNNGKLATVESHIGTTKQWAQKFTYDAIGRLKQSEETKGATTTVTYKQTFDFDRFGNMYRKFANNGTSGQENPLPYTPIEETTTPGTGRIDKQTNRFRTDTIYDDAGNVTTDNKFRTMGFGYDANGRMVKATKTSVPDALSVYDASGMRVAEKVNDVWRFLIYDVGGKMVAEYGGFQSTDEGGVKYLLSDWQGSTRAVLSNTGVVNGRTDYSAFGEEIGSGTGMRTSAQGFGAANAPRQKYGLTERDDGTGLDHTWFRKHENRAGRWTSADPYGGSMSIGDPQSFNRYSYVQSQPTNFVDPSGLMMECGFRTLVITSCIEGFGCTVDSVESIFVCTGSNYNPFSNDPGVGGGGGGGGGGTPQGPGPGVTSQRELRIQICMKEKIRNRVSGVNKRRDNEWTLSIVGSMTPHIIQSPFPGLLNLSLFPDYINNDKDALAKIAVIGILKDPLGTMGNVFGATIREGTVGAFNYRNALAAARKEAPEDRQECEKEVK